MNSFDAVPVLPAVVYPGICAAFAVPPETDEWPDAVGTDHLVGQVQFEKVGFTYPDGTQGQDGRIFIIYDRDRRTAREILLATFTEQDILAHHCVSASCHLRGLLSKGSR